MKKGKTSLIIATDSPLNAESPLSSLRPRITPVSSFFIRSHFAIPRVKLSNWRLGIEGDVERECVFGYADLLRMPTRTVSVTLECAGNGRSGFRTAAKDELRWGHGAVGTARWTGVPLRAVLESVGVRTGASEVVAEGADSGAVRGLPGEVPYSRSLPLEKAMQDDTIIALRMNGQRLSPEHGYPARLVVPGWYGMASVKWLRTIRLVSGSPRQVFFNTVKYVYVETEQGKETRTPVRELRVNSIITNPADGGSIEAGRTVRVTGRAWSGQAAVSRVEVDLGSGWRNAELSPKRVGRFEWVEWRKDWTPKRTGEMTIAARATDEKGNVQPLEPWENKLQYGYNAVAKVRVRVV
ncbi:MAG: sulfite oxidase [Nitrososphaerota archaeon]|nr:sulfite oxidase [Nitrososphaerota archaeon]